MAYEGKTIWKNREVENPRTFIIQQNPDSTITLIPAEGTIIEPGTPIIAAIMNNIEDGIEEAHNSIGNINDPTLPAELKGKALTEQTKYVLANAGKVKSVNNKTGNVVINKEDIGLMQLGVNLGQQSVTDGSGVAIGYKAQAAATGTALGTYANVLGTSAVAAGAYAKAVKQSVAIGNEANSPKENGVAIGNKSVNGAGSGVAIGDESLTAGNFSMALGQGTLAESNFSIAIGTQVASKNSQEGILGSDGYTNKWIVPGSFTVKGTKNFEIPHPNPNKKATHMLRHAAVESPTAGDTLYRYKVIATKENDLVTINLPDYFIHLNKDVQIFVTPQGHFGNGYGVLNRETEQLEIHCQYEGEYNVLVIGTRNDDHQSVQDWDIKGVEREIGESWTGETYVFEVDEIIEVEEIKEVA